MPTIDIGTPGAGATTIDLVPLPHLYRIDISATGFRNDEGPLISGFNPAAASVLDRDGTITLDVTDGTGLAFVLVSVRYPALGFEHVIYRGEFAQNYGASAGSSAVAIDDGLRFTIARAGGWLDSMEIIVEAVDDSGATSSAVVGYEVSGTLEALAAPPATVATFEAPSLEELIEYARTGFRTLPGGETPLFERSVERVLMMTQAALAHGVYGNIQFVADQILPDRGGEDAVIRWSQILGLPLRYATAATGEVAFTASSGAELPNGSRLTRSDGVAYETTATAVESGGIITATVESVDTGASTNTIAGATLSLQSPVSGVATSGIVGDDGIAGGRDDDDIETLRAFVLERLRQPTRGGSSSDYQRWAREVDGVANAYVSAQQLGPGTVVVAITVEGDNPIPSAAMVDEVQAYLETKAPATARVTTVAPSTYTLDLELSISPDREDVRAAVVAALRALIASEAVPGELLLVSHIREAISGAAGEHDHTLISPTADIDPGPSGLVVLGSIDWT
jgi:uncharacterized phage protein gp47/JayE